MESLIEKFDKGTKLTSFNLKTETLKVFIQEYFTSEIKNIEKEKKGLKNISKSFRGIGEWGEEFVTLIYPNSIGSASKGGCAFDNNEYQDGNLVLAREIKTCCLMQPKECINCKEKVPYFQEKCIFCDKSNFTLKTDSRFTINAKSHFEYISLIKEYILILLEHNASNLILLKVFLIKSDNVYFTNYLKNQKDNSNSPNCNLVPYSYDFYSSGPIQIIHTVLDLKGNILQFNSNETPLDFDTKVLTIDERKKMEINVSSIPYEQIKDKLVLRSKNLNKERGTTTRIKGN